MKCSKAEPKNPDMHGTRNDTKCHLQMFSYKQKPSLTEVSAAIGTRDLYAAHAHRVVDMAIDSPGNIVPVSRPPVSECSAIVRQIEACDQWYNTRTHIDTCDRILQGPPKWRCHNIDTFLDRQIDT